MENTRGAHRPCGRSLGLLRLVPLHTRGVRRKNNVVSARTYPRQKGEEVVLLIVDDISRVPLVPLLRVPQPDCAGPGLASTAASQPLAAPVEKTRPHRQGHALPELLSLKHHHWVRTTAPHGASSFSGQGKQT